MASPARAGEETFTATDGMPIAATYHEAAGKPKKPVPAVVLVHMYSRSREDWKAVAAQLQKEGFAVLAIDMRGHGGSTRRGGRELAWKTMDGAEWLASVGDVRGAIAHLRAKKEIDGGRIALVGASVGANLVLNGAAAEEEAKSGVRGVALLSPGANYCGVETAEAMKRYGTGRLFLAASEDDPEACADTRALAEAAADPKKVLKIYPKAGHGTEMFGREEPRGDLAKSLLEWLREAMK